jgi:hypothetical protein
VQENRSSFSRGATCERFGEANDAFVQTNAKALNSPSVLPREHRVYVNITQNRKVKFIARNICHTEKSEIVFWLNTRITEKSFKRKLHNFIQSTFFHVSICSSMSHFWENVIADSCKVVLPVLNKYEPQLTPYSYPVEHPFQEFSLHLEVCVASIATTLPKLIYCPLQ